MTITRRFRPYLAVAVGVLLCTMAARAADKAGDKKVRIIQTNSAGDNVHVIDPVTNKVVGVISGIEVSHGAAGASDGSRTHVSEETDNPPQVVPGGKLNRVRS